MTKQQLETISNEFAQAIHDYKQSNEFDETELENIIDNLLCRLPRDVVYVEWFDRNDIKNMADSVYDEPASEDLVDMCMEDLDKFNGNFIDNESMQLFVEESVRQHKGA